MARESGNVYTKSEPVIDLAITAMTSLVLGAYLAVIGAIMTGLSYAWENRTNYTSVAESYGLRTDVAGPVMLSIGSAGVIMATILISVFQVWAPPETTTTSTGGHINSGYSGSVISVSYHVDPARY